MPTVILLDVSLSMTRPIPLAETNDITRKYLATKGINAFLDHLSIHSKLEFISLIAFSSLYEEKCPFTRDYNVIKSELQNINDYDKTCIEAALHGVNQIVLGEWGNNTPCQVLLITDGSTGIGPMSLKESFATLNMRTLNNAFPVPFAFPAKLHIVCITQASDPVFLKSKPLLQKLIDMSGYDGSLLVPEHLNESSISLLFEKLAEEMYVSFKGTLKCGNLESKIFLSPSPVPYTKVSDFDCRTYTLSDLIEVCGFIPVSDVGSPMAISRHLILPAPINSKENIPSTQEAGHEDENFEEGTTPSFCVLLHGALKVEDMAALVTVADNWFGFIYSWADSKKKSNLMLTLLTPGSDAVPWLGDLNNLDVADNLSPEQIGNFPVRPVEKRSYYQSNIVVWIKQAGLQSDIQKILRHARRLPEKTQQFYKDVNRLRKAAISLGFLELLNGVAAIFEQECTQLPGTAHPDCALQLSHAADVLRETQNKDVKYSIMPLQTKYNS